MSWYQELTEKPKRVPKTAISRRGDSKLKPLRRCSGVLTLTYPIATCIVGADKAKRFTEEQIIAVLGRAPPPDQEAALGSSQVKCQFSAPTPTVLAVSVVPSKLPIAVTI